MTIYAKRAPVWIWADGKLLDGRFHLQEVAQVQGGARRNRATIEVTPLISKKDKPQGLFSAARLDSYFTSIKRIEVAIGTVENIVHRGYVIGGRAKEGSSSTWLLSSRLDPHHVSFPVTLASCATWRSTELSMPFFTNASLRHHDETTDDIVFNPTVDGNTLGNCFPNPVDPLMRHPDSLIRESENPQLYNERGEILPTVAKWTLAQAVRYICRNCFFPDKINVPELSALNSLGDGVLDVPMPETRIPFGTDAFKALDRILKPFGHTWTINFLSNTIEIIARQDRIDVEIKGELGGFDFEWDHVDQTAENVIVFGDHYQFEGTFELVPAWKAEYDDYTVSELKRNSSKWEADPESRRAWREWVLNETGEYNATRFNNTAFDAAKFFKDAFDDWNGTRVNDKPTFALPDKNEDTIARRRRFLPTLTQNGQGRPVGENRGVFIEFWDGDNWRPVVGGSNDSVITRGINNGRSFQLMQNECGIVWTADEIPVELKAIGLDTLKVRVTATLEADARPVAQTIAPGYFADKPNPLIRVDKSYKVQSVARKGEYASRFIDALDARKFIADEQDDRAEMQALSDRLADSWSTATLKGNVALKGIYSDEIVGLAVGYTITKINDGSLPPTYTPRQLDMSTRRGRAPDGPRIIEIIFQVNAQRTVLKLESTRGRTT